MKPTTSDKAHHEVPVTPLTHLSVCELLQRLASCEDALRADPSAVATADAPETTADRRAILHQQDQIVRELRRRRYFRGVAQSERRRSAAWPPPPW